MSRLKELFLDASGKLSGKRFWGAVSITTAIALAVYGIAKDNETAIQMVYAFLGFGATTLGLGAFELERKSK